MSHYVGYSRRIFAILREYSPLVEPISIDEAFVDLTGTRRLFGKPSEVAMTIKKRIRDELGLTASVGVAANKFLAKLASDLEKPDGFVIIQPKEAAARLANLPISKLWGVGKVTRAEFERRGVHVVKELLALPQEELEGIVGSWALRLRQLAQGIDDRPVITGEASKSVGAETTFAEDIADGERLRAILDTLAARVARRLRTEGYRAHTIQLKARYADFKTVTRAMTLPHSTASTNEIIKSSRELFEEKLDRGGRALRLVGVSTSNLVRPAEGEPELFPDTKREQEERVDHMVDALQKKFGSGKIWRGPRLHDEESV